MKKTDKNIIIITILGIIGITTWTLMQYFSSQEKKEKTLLEESMITEEKVQKEPEKEIAPEKIIPEISTVELSKKMNSDEEITIIDARSTVHHESGHIRGSVPLEHINIADAARTIIFVTTTGNEDLIVNHYRDISKTKTVYNLTGGINQWQKEGRALLSLNSTPTFVTSGKVQFVEPRDLDGALRKPIRAEKIMVIDVRRNGNYTKGHIPTAINIPFLEIESRYKELHRTKEIYIYGTDESASFQAGVLLYDLGYINAKTIKGGFAAWKKYNYPIVEQVIE
ncbi:MAG: hypothetical protein CR972_02020 [Candidatus Moraniibacteriota bacterium]|nr:MAG: hypothetical protein CR972_02020 [Candidatus Moranbacteria bacterium]